MQERSMSLRNAAVAATLAATVGIWAVAMWAWLGPGLSTAPTSVPTTAGTRVPAVNGLTDRDSHAQPAPQPPPEQTATTDRDAKPLLASQPPPASSKTADEDVSALPPLQSSPPRGTAADDRTQALGRATPPETGTAVVRGIQASLPSEVGSDGNTAVVRGKQAPSTPPDSGPAVVRGGRATSGSSAP